MPEINPSVFIPTPNQEAPKLKKAVKLNPKLMFAAILVLVVIALIFVAKNYLPTSQKVASTPTRTVKAVPKPRLVLVSDKKEYKVGDGVILAVGLSTGGKNTDGTDVVLHYDDKVLQASSSSIIRGTLYPEYPQLAVQKGGIVRISGISSPNKSYSGEGVFATILFQAIKPGKSSVTIDYQSGSTTDSNIVDMAGKDVLAEADGLEVTVK